MSKLELEMLNKVVDVYIILLKAAKELFNENKGDKNTENMIKIIEAICHAISKQSAINEKESEGN